MMKNVASQSVGCQMLSASDGSDFTGTVTVYVTVDNGAQALGGTGSGVCTHEGNGYHSYVPTQAETNGKHLAFTFKGTGAITVTVQVYTSFVDDILARDWTGFTGEAARSVLNALRAIRNKWAVGSGTLSVKKEDDATEAWNAAVSSDAAAEPIIGSDPS